jgi:hypothetical protein
VLLRWLAEAEVGRLVRIDGSEGKEGERGTRRRERRRQLVEDSGLAGVLCQYVVHPLRYSPDLLLAEDEGRTDDDDDDLHSSSSCSTRSDKLH